MTKKKKKKRRAAKLWACIADLKQEAAKAWALKRAKHGALVKSMAECDRERAGREEATRECDKLRGLLQYTPAKSPKGVVTILIGLAELQMLKEQAERADNAEARLAVMIRALKKLAKERDTDGCYPRHSS